MFIFLVFYVGQDVWYFQDSVLQFGSCWSGTQGTCSATLVMGIEDGKRFLNSVFIFAAMMMGTETLHMLRKCSLVSHAPSPLLDNMGLHIPLDRAVILT